MEINSQTYNILDREMKPRHKLNRLLSNINKKNSSSKIHTWDEEHSELVDGCSHGLEVADNLIFFKEDINWYTLDESDEQKKPLKPQHIQLFVSVDICDDRNNTDILNTRNIILKIKKKKSNMFEFNEDLKRIRKFLRISNTMNFFSKKSI